MYFSVNDQHITDLQERIKNANKTYFMQQKFQKIKTYTSETWKLTKKVRKQMNIFERKVYRRILGPVYGNEKENWGY